LVVIIFLVLTSSLLTNELSNQSRFDSLLTCAEMYYAKGDSFFTSTQVDSVLKNYLQARKIINELFFRLLEAKKNDSLETAVLTEHWDKVVSKMQVKLKEIPNCEFDRCSIYQEEKVANWCIEILEQEEVTPKKEIMKKFILILEKDAKAQFKDIFDKIYTYLRLKISLRRLREALSPGKKSKPQPIDQTYYKFMKFYQDYKSNLAKG
jgi:hypothetical protein